MSKISLLKEIGTTLEKQYLFKSGKDPKGVDNTDALKNSFAEVLSLDSVETFANFNLSTSSKKTIFDLLTSEGLEEITDEFLSVMYKGYGPCEKISEEKRIDEFVKLISNQFVPQESSLAFSNFFVKRSFDLLREKKIQEAEAMKFINKCYREVSRHVTQEQATQKLSEVFFTLNKANKVTLLKAMQSAIPEPHNLSNPNYSELITGLLGAADSSENLGKVFETFVACGIPLNSGNLVQELEKLQKIKKSPVTDEMLQKITGFLAEASDTLTYVNPLRVTGAAAGSSGGSPTPANPLTAHNPLHAGSSGGSPTPADTSPGDDGPSRRRRAVVPSFSAEALDGQNQPGAAQAGPAHKKDPTLMGKAKRIFGLK